MIKKILEQKNMFLNYYNNYFLDISLLIKFFNSIGNSICKYDFFVGFNVKRLRT